MTQSQRVDSLSHAQRERLAFIDFRLYFFGEIGRPDLIERFGVAPAGATRDLAQYREIALQNIEFDGSNKIYLIGKTFSPIFEHATQRVLSALALGFGDGVKVESQPLLHCESPAALSSPPDRCAGADLPSHPRQATHRHPLPLDEQQRDRADHRSLCAGTFGRLTESPASSATSSSPALKRRPWSMKKPRPTSARITTSSGFGSWSWTWCRIRVSPAPRSSK